MIEKAAEHAVEEVTHYAVHQEPMVFLVILLILFIVACGVVITYLLGYWIWVVGKKAASFIDDLHKRVTCLFATQAEHIAESTKKKQLIEDTDQTCRDTHKLVRKIAQKMEVEY